MQAFEKIFKKSQKRPFFQRSLGVGVGSCDTVVGESNRTHMIPSMVHQGRAANSQLRGSYIPRSGALSHIHPYSGSEYRTTLIPRATAMTEGTLSLQHIVAAARDTTSSHTYLFVFDSRTPIVLLHSPSAYPTSQPQPRKQILYANACWLCWIISQTKKGCHAPAPQCVAASTPTAAA